MQYAESRLQIACVTWFRYQYPHLAFLLFHPKNEGHGDQVAGARAKAEGVVPGVPDLILAIPNARHCMLCIEMKTAKGRQSESQKRYQRMAETATAEYHVCRDVNTFQNIIAAYLSEVPTHIINALSDLHRLIENEKSDQERQKLQKILKRKKQWKPHIPTTAVNARSLGSPSTASTAQSSDATSNTTSSHHARRQR